MFQVRAILCAAALAAVSATTAGAQSFNTSRITYLTFSGPVQVPGATLPAGTYEFRLADPISQRQIIQIRDKESSKIFGTLMSIPNRAMEPKDDPTVMFLETPAGQPAAIKAWFYPGDRTGYEFVYPKEQAMRIASYSKDSVLAYSGDVKAESEMASSQVGRVNPQGDFVNDEPASSGAAAAESTTAAQSTTAGQSTTAVQTQTPPAPTPSANRTESRAAVGTTGEQAGQSEASARTRSADASSTAPARQLPRTGSDLGLVIMLGGGLLAAGFALREARRSRS